MLFSFEANNLQANINRWYNLRIGKNLFGEWILITSWGRKGRKGGQKKEYTFSSLQETLQKTKVICKKRLNASSRIGCNYSCTNYNLTQQNVEEFLKGSLQE